MNTNEPIRTIYDPKPIPMRYADWSAYREGYDGGDPIGWGATKYDAVADLLAAELLRAELT